MNTDYLEEFLAVAFYKNFTKAATHLKVSQSSLTRHIQTLEEEIGRPLFVRNKHTVSLTLAGNYFKSHAQNITQLNHSFINGLNEYEAIQHSANAIHIGTMLHLDENLLCSFTQNCFQEFPDINICFETHPVNRIFHYLRNGLLDFAFLYLCRTGEPGILNVPFLQDKLIAHIPENHRLYSTDRLHISTISQENIYVSSGPDDALYRYIKNEFENLSLNNIVLNSHTVICQSSVEENSIYLTPSLMSSDFHHLCNYKAVDLFPTIDMILDIRYSSEMEMTPIKKEFLTFCRLWGNNWQHHII